MTSLIGVEQAIPKRNLLAEDQECESGEQVIRSLLIRNCGSEIEIEDKDGGWAPPLSISSILS
jgi:hypothetical protein